MFLKKYLKDFFTYEGRMGRRTYVKDFLVAGLLALLISLFLLVVVLEITEFIFDLNYSAFLLKNGRYLADVIRVIIWSFPAIKRIHDLNWSGWILSLFVFTQVCGLLYWEDSSSEGWWYAFEVLNTFEQEFLFFMTGLYLINFIVILILFFKKGTTGSNKYGSDPLAG